jgi:hypothetical protein
VAEPKYNNEQRVFFVTFDIGLSLAHFVFIFRLGVELKLLANLRQQNIVTFFEVTRLE